MREIKFRGWNGKQMVSAPDVDVRMDGSITWSWGVLMQYTGLKDKNGKDIYEGDIVKAKHTTVPVWWSDELARWEMSDPKDFEDYIVHNGEDYEVIGNIYENPELLNKGQNSLI